jgi:hypothetical protein
MLQYCIIFIVLFFGLEIALIYPDYILPLIGFIFMAMILIAY